MRALLALVAVAFFTFMAQVAQGQGSSAHCKVNGANPILACWNFEAGKDMPRDYSEYPEVHPFLDGWDWLREGIGDGRSRHLCAHRGRLHASRRHLP